MTVTTLLLDLPAMTIRRAVVSAMANNVYLLTAKHSGTQVLIDAADDAAAISSLIVDAASDAGASTHLELVATTHSHWDHVRALDEITAQYDVPSAAGADDAHRIEEQTGVAAACVLGHGDVLDLDGVVLTAVHLRGHTPGSMAFVWESPDEATTVIFSGDSLFPGGVGNTEQDPQRFSSLLDDVEERLFAIYSDDTVVLPGHGDATTLGAERPALPEWRKRGW